MKLLPKKICLIVLTLLSFTTFASDKKIVRFATEATYPPFVSLSSENKMEGFETELVKTLCTKANLDCTFTHLPFDSLFLSLKMKKIDAVFGGVGISEARKSSVLFSDPIYKNTVGFVFLEKLNQRKIIGVQQGTTGFEKYLKEKYGNTIELKYYPSIQEALLDLKANRVEGVFGDVPVFRYWLKNQNQADYKIITVSEKEGYFSEGNGIAMRKEDSETMRLLNQAFKSIQEDGSYQKLITKHGME